MKKDLPLIVRQAQIKARSDKKLKELLFFYLKKISLFNNDSTKLHFVRTELEKLLTEKNEDTACKKGCHYCCHHPIALSRAEMSDIMRDHPTYDEGRLKQQKKHFEN